VTISAGTLVPREARDFGNYELVAKLATGGMAEIFLARRTDAVGRGDLVVIKRILPHLADDEHFVTMFRDEAALASKLEHANVCKVFTLGSAQGTHFIVMEYLHGVALSRMLTRLAKQRLHLDVRQVARIVIDACEGLHHAHELKDAEGHLLGVVHRDVSPPNIFLCADGTVKLLDFGIAKARGAGSKTRTGTVKGKNAYMSPEQILGKPLDRRSDVFALGAVMYELLAVKRLFHRDSDFLTFKAITEEPIPDIRDRRSDILPSLREIVHRALARDVAARYATAQDMADALRAAVAPVGGPSSSFDLGRMISSDFSDELAAKEQLCLAQAMGPVDADSSSVPTLAITSGTVPIANAQTVVDKPRRGNQLPALEGEVVARSRATPTRPPPIPGATPAVVVPQMEPSGPTQRQPVDPLGAPPPLPGVANAIAPLAILPATGESMTGASMAVDLNTDLLGARRRSFVVKAVVATVLGAAATLAIVLGAGGDATPKPAAAPDAGAAVATPKLPVKVPVAADGDAGVSKDDIKRFARFGYFSIDADDKTVIYVDNNRIGETPLKSFPLEPGPHKVRAEGPRRKKKFFDIIIFGGDELPWGKITW
jgi:serine/threonine-protein kinase